MTQQNILFAFLIIITTLFITSCEKDTTDLTDITRYHWEVIKIKQPGASSYSRAEGSYVLEFGDTFYKINLDVNDCRGAYEILSDKKINIAGSFCTKVCCDTDFAKKLISLLPGITSYHRKQNKLLLGGGGGEIILKKF